MESNEAFINSYRKLKELHEAAKIICDHIADANADDQELEMENITVDRIIEGGFESTRLLEEMAKDGELPAAHKILEHYCRVFMRGLEVCKDEEFLRMFKETFGEEYDRARTNLYCDEALTVAQCLIRHHDIGYWY